MDQSMIEKHEPPDSLAESLTSTSLETSADPQFQSVGKQKRKRKSAEAGDPPRKKKANRACFHCQKAHLTCDDARPCARCIKRGLQDNCTDGIRKKAKYLLEDDELEELKRTQPPKKKTTGNALNESSVPQTRHETPTTGTFPGHQQFVPQISAQPQPTTVVSPSFPTSAVAGPSSQPALIFPFTANSQDFSFLNPSPSLDPNLSDSFTSEALNMEFNILSQILGNSQDVNGKSWLDSPSLAGIGSTPFLTPYSFSPAPQPPPQSSTQQQPQALPPHQFSNDPSNQVVWPSNSPPEEIVPVSQNPPDLVLNPLIQKWRLDPGNGSPPANPAWPASPQTDSGALSGLPHGIGGSKSLAGNNSANTYLNTPSPAPSFPSSSTPPSYHGPGDTCGESGSSLQNRTSSFSSTIGLPGLGSSRPEPSELRKIFEIVTQPYDYTQGYHFLMRFLKEKFAKNDILRIVRALAIFRPSIIALQMPLSLDDEVFVERCFQRSLLELEKLMAFTGTPTVVWRRTGEICLVADEFLLLTGWERSELLPTPMQTQGNSGGRDQPSRKYIYELFDPTSTVEYWENFAQHAFENATHSVSSHCALLRPDGSPVLCSFCFTVRRDMFDLPSLIVGQWLPLL